MIEIQILESWNLPIGFRKTRGLSTIMYWRTMPDANRNQARELVMKNTSHMGDVTRTVKGSGAGNGKEPKTWRLGQLWPPNMFGDRQYEYCIMVENPN